MRENGRLSLAERYAVLERDSFRCQMCGIGGKNSDWILEVDHIDGNGKNHVMSNLQTLCVRCHNDKHPWRVNKEGYRVFRFSQRRKSVHQPHLF